MSRYNYAQLGAKPATPPTVRPIVIGGTGATTVPDAVTALEGIPVSQVNAANGVLGLDGNGQIVASQITSNAPNGIAKLNESGQLDTTLFATNSANGFVQLDSNGSVPGATVSSGSSITLDGSGTAVTGVPSAYTITNYDSATAYTVSGILGSVTVSGETITFTPNAAGAGGIVINGATFAVNVIPPYVQTPSLISPVNGSTGTVVNILLTGSAFAMVGSADVHSMTSWQVATDSGFTNIVAQSLDNATNLTSWQVSGLTTNTLYYARVKYKGANSAYSAWSTAISFTTKQYAYPVIEQSILTASDKAANDCFGYSVSLSSDGNTALIGAYYKTASGLGNAGQAYIFTRSGTAWTRQAILTASDKAATDYFGRSVSLSSDGNTALIGAYFKTVSGVSQAGQAYIFTRSGTTWTQQAILTASDKAYDNRFGNSVSLSSDGNTALIGAYYKTVSGFSYVGQAYIFTRSGTTWTQQAILSASNKANYDYFAWSVSLSSDGNTALIGAHGEAGSGFSGIGQAYIFTRSGTTWTQQAILTASDKAESDQFGYSVSLSSDGNTALIGAYLKTVSGVIQAGQAYIFTRSGTTWTQQAILSASDKALGDQFGISVSLSSDGNTALIGAYYKDPDAVTNAGQAYIFTRSGATWTQQAILSASDKTSNDYFGQSVSLSSDGNTALIGAYFKTVSGVSYAGQAYIFS